MGLHIFAQEGLWRSVIGFFFPIVVLWLLFYIGAIGAGDVKIFGMLGSYLGVGDLSKIMLYSLFFAGVAALFHGIREGFLVRRMQGLAVYISKSIQNKKIEPYEVTVTGEKRAWIHLTAAILGGWICYLLN
ncbi:MAG: A24 family peptidase [Lachnospiraceae bacterium]|nr:A24 family peptidase [Lachnospiraceae bacterium]